MGETDLLHDVELVNAKGERALADHCLDGKILALFFAADWCPDCRAFQPSLNAFYEHVNQEQAVLEVVFISSDATEETQVSHLSDKQGPWWMVPFDSPARNTLKRRYGVCAMKEQAEVGVKMRNAGIPSLVIVHANGDIIDMEGAAQVERHNYDAVDTWQANVAQRQN